MQNKYGYRKLKLVYQDTDSLIYQVYTQDIYKDIEKDQILKNYFDFSEYPEDHPLHSVENKKVVGKMKDELNGKIITEIVAIRPKQYAYKTLDGKEHKKNKGIKKNVVKKDTTLKDYRDSLFNKSVVKRKQYCIRSVKHQLFTQEIEKIVFDNRDKSTFNDEEKDSINNGYKRMILKKGYKTKAFSSF
uniref:DNA-directed DNA polymerase n=1 Tax=Caenorhabditis japonica TaxID=281687 RepID=A0A8R1DYL3_CAEJA